MWPVLTAHVRFLLSFGSPACFFMQFITIFSPGFLIELLQRPGYVAFLLWALVLSLKHLQKICSGLNLRNLLSYVMWFCRTCKIRLLAPSAIHHPLSSGFLVELLQGREMVAFIMFFSCALLLPSESSNCKARLTGCFQSCMPGRLQSFWRSITLCSTQEFVLLDF